MSNQLPIAFLLYDVFINLYIYEVYCEGRHKESLVVQCYYLRNDINSGQYQTKKLLPTLRCASFCILKSRPTGIFNWFGSLKFELTVKLSGFVFLKYLTQPANLVRFGIKTIAISGQRKVGKIAQFREEILYLLKL
jgi:hypothetical protein